MNNWKKYPACPGRFITFENTRKKVLSTMSATEKPILRQACKENARSSKLAFEIPINRENYDNASYFLEPELHSILIDWSEKYFYAIEAFFNNVTS